MTDGRRGLWRIRQRMIVRPSLRLLGFAAALVATCLLSGVGATAIRPDMKPALVAKLTAPMFATAAPRDSEHLYVATRGGAIRVLEGSHVLPTPLLDLRGRVSTQGERGLLSIAFDPAYAHDGFVYAAYTDLAGSMVVSRFHVVDGVAAVGSEKRLLRVTRPSSHQFHYGGQLAFGPDRALYVSTGDGGYATRVCDRKPRSGGTVVICKNAGIDVGHAQNLETLFGKILRLDVSAPTPTPTVVAYGLRNPWRFSFDQATGAVYIGDVGYDRFEEVDYATHLAGRPLNFGWSYYEAQARQEHGASSLNPAGRLVRPLYVYDHTQRNCSITGGYVYRGDAVPSLRGRYVFGDWCSGRVWSLRLVGGKASDVRIEPATIRLIVSFGVGPDGELYALTLNGGVYRLTD